MVLMSDTFPIGVNPIKAPGIKTFAQKLEAICFVPVVMWTFQT